MTEEDKAPYKAKAAEINNISTESDKQLQCPKCDKTFLKNEDLINHLVSEHVEQRGHSLTGNQSTIHKCNNCGRMFFTEERLQIHMKDDHTNGVEVESVTLEETLEEVPGDVATYDDEADEAEEIAEGEVPGDVATYDDIADEAEEIAEGEETSLVWVKLANIFWPAKVTRKIDGD